MDFQLDLLNPCTLMPTDFQLYRKMKQILFSVFFFCSRKTKLDFHFCYAFADYKKEIRKRFSDGKSRGALLARAALRRFIRNWHSFPYSLVITKPFYAL